MPIENLWPADLDAPELPETPGQILRRQAAYLRELTRDLVEGEVAVTTSGDQIVHRFYAKAPLLDYRVQLLDVAHGLDAYPARVIWPKAASPPTEVGDPDEFRAALREIFGHGTTRRTIGQLRAYAREQGSPFLLVEDEEIVGEAKTLARALRRAREVVSQDSEVRILCNDVEAGSVRNINGVVTEHVVGQAATP